MIKNEDILTELDIIADWFEVGSDSGKESAKNRLQHLMKLIGNTIAVESEGNERFSVEPSGGMDLRDYFAAMALNHAASGSPIDRAEWAYQVADAMIKERNK